MKHAVEKAALENKPLFGYSSLTLKSPLLYLLLGATVAIYFVGEAFNEKKDGKKNAEDRVHGHRHG